MKITAILSALAAATLVSAGKYHDLQGADGRSNIVPGAYIIQYHDNVDHKAAHNALNSRKIDFKVRSEYNVFNGAAISVNSSHGGKDLAAIPGVKDVWPVTTYKVPKATPSKNNKPTDPEVVSYHSMTGVDIVHKKYKLTGKGIKVGVIDTGIDYKHPAFAAKGAKEGCFARYGKNCRVAHGWDFVGDDYDGYNTPKPDADPMDCQSHGTHVAGIIGANAMNIQTPAPPQPFIGVAPEVTFGSYRVFGCKGEASDDVILAAMELAFNDGMDIINMSLGGGSSYKYNPTAVLAEKLIAHGMILAAAAGNDGSSGVWMVSDTGLGDSATSIASFDNIIGKYNSFTYGGAPHPYNPSVTWAKPIDLPASATLFPLIGADGKLQDGCDVAQYPAAAKGKVVLVFGDFSKCGSVGRGGVALGFGAAGMLVQTTPVGLVNLSGVAGLPMAGIENKAGDAVLAAYKANPAAPITWSKAASDFIVEGGGAPSGFSSFGLDGELRSKPDIGAPGGNILSTIPLYMGGYGLKSGTSMATPYVAGSHALYMQYKKTKPLGQDIRKVFKNTATISKNAGSKTFTSAAKQGAGLINVLRAILTTTSITPDHIDLLDTNHFQKKVTIWIKNSGKHTETYDLSHVPADSLNSYPNKNSFPLITPLVEADSASVAFSESKIKVKGGKTAKVTLQFREPATGDASHFPLYSGYVVATPRSKGAIAVSVPYTGVKGDIAKVPIQDTSREFPGLTLSDGKDDLLDIPANHVFDIKKGEKPVVLSRLGSHTPNLHIRVSDAQKKFVGFLNTAEMGTANKWSGRHTNADSKQQLQFSKYKWAGLVVPQNSTAAVQLPSGTYNIEVASQHKLSKGDYPADFEIFDLGNVQIQV